MVFHDDDAIADVVNATVHTIKEATHKIGASERRVSAEQRARIEGAIKELLSALKSRKVRAIRT